jgi:hypothetical protein
MVFFFVLCCSVSVYRPSTKKPAQPGGQWRLPSGGTTSGPRWSGRLRARDRTDAEESEAEKDLKTVKTPSSNYAQRAQLAGIIAKA